ncbi:hypothetical protein DID78_03025, partial [Candidatus Marinamargulisbacteria bacterium SCGC AG-343-D04]
NSRAGEVLFGDGRVYRIKNRAGEVPFGVYYFSFSQQMPIHPRPKTARIHPRPITPEHLIGPPIASSTPHQSPVRAVNKRAMTTSFNNTNRPMTTHSNYSNRFNTFNAERLMNTHFDTSKIKRPKTANFNRSETLRPMWNYLKYPIPQLEDFDSRDLSVLSEIEGDTTKRNDDTTKRNDDTTLGSIDFNIDKSYLIEQHGSGIFFNNRSFDSSSTGSSADSSCSEWGPGDLSSWGGASPS